MGVCTFSAVEACFHYVEAPFCTTFSVEILRNFLLVNTLEAAEWAAACC